MPLYTPLRQVVLFSLPFLAPTLWVGSAGAQVTEVVVGITPSCPYGIGACWSGAYEALGHLDGVKSVAETPDAYNCTARLFLKAEGLPDVDRWAEGFKSMVGQLYGFRGVEVTVAGSVEGKDDGLVLRAPGLEQPITLAPLRDKLQWNFKKTSARQPEPDERDAYGQLAAKKKVAKDGAFEVQVTGPLKKTATGYVLEVREFFPMTTSVDPYGRR